MLLFNFVFIFIHIYVAFCQLLLEQVLWIHKKRSEETAGHFSLYHAMNKDISYYKGKHESVYRKNSTMKVIFNLASNVKKQKQKTTRVSII